MMLREPSTVTATFEKIKELSERLSRSVFSAIVAAFEAYGTALCGHVPTACPTEQITLRTESKQEASAIREPRTKTFAVARNRSNRKIPVVPQCQL
jgi:hypothetical protein